LNWKRQTAVSVLARLGGGLCCGGGLSSTSSNTHPADCYIQNQRMFNVHTDIQLQQDDQMINEALQPVLKKKIFSFNHDCQ